MSKPQPPRIVGDDGEFVFELPPAPERPSEISSPARTIELRAGWLVLMMLVVAGAIALLMTSRIARPTPNPHILSNAAVQMISALRPVNMADVSLCSLAQMSLSEMRIVLASGNIATRGSALYLLSPTNRDVCLLDINTTAFEPRWMPDESRILYAGVQGNRRDLFTWSFPQEISTLTTSARSELGAVWAPDGRSVYFVAGEALQRIQVTTESPLASPQRVMNSFVAPEIAISSDGQSIAFISSQTAQTALDSVSDRELHISRLDGTGIRRLTFNTVRDSEPAWSPDGRWIAWVSDGQIWLYDLIENVSFPFIAKRGFLASNPVWLPTDDGIAFILQTPDTPALVVQIFSGEFRIISGAFNSLTSFDWR